MELKDSKTLQNLMAAFTGESQARNKYTFYAQKARDDGYVHIAEIFEETAHNEKEHAEIWFKLINDGLGETRGNLEDAAGGEHYEWSEMYAEFSKTATEEGFTRIAALFDLVAKIEKEHEIRYRTLQANIETGRVFSRDSETTWICTNCGHIHTGSEAPKQCPVCEKNQSYFKERETNY